jgi:hypothetical protein
VRNRVRRGVARDPKVGELAEDERCDLQVTTAVEAARARDVFVPSTITATVRDGPSPSKARSFGRPAIDSRMAWRK